MKHNMTKMDRFIRLAFFVLALGLFAGGILVGIIGKLCIAIGFILLATGLLGFCPIYTVLGIRTKKSQSH